MKWWQDERKAILRPEQRITAKLWIAAAAVGLVVGGVHLVAWWLA
jgi:hypothetical protein